MTRFRTSGKNWEGRSWVLTAGGVVLARQVEAIWPDPHPSDGTVASKGHDTNNPTSDHRPRPFTGPGVVRALDVGENTEDDGIAFAEMLRASRDPRIKYVLHENRIFSSYARGSRAAWEWGSLAIGHPDHVHVSFEDRADSDPSPWKLKGDDMQLPPERRADLQALIDRGWIVADINYYYPTPGQPSADLPAEVWMNLNLAAVGGAARTAAADHNHDGRYLKDVEGVT